MAWGTAVMAADDGLSGAGVVDPIAYEIRTVTDFLAIAGTLSPAKLGELLDDFRAWVVINAAVPLLGYKVRDADVFRGTLDGKREMALTVSRGAAVRDALGGEKS